MSKIGDLKNVCNAKLQMSMKTLFFYNEFQKCCPFSHLEARTFSKTGSDQKKTLTFFPLGFWHIVDLVNLHKVERCI